MRATLYGLAIILLTLAAVMAMGEQPWSPKLSRTAALLGAAVALLAYALPELGAHT